MVLFVVTLFNRGRFERKKMEQNVDQKPPKMNVNIPELDMMNTFKKHSHMLVSPTSQAAAPRKSSSGRWNCLCSPTTHAGSFRCRHHRSTAEMHRGRSIGSNLSELAEKASAISDSLHAQQLACVVALHGVAHIHTYSYYIIYIYIQWSQLCSDCSSQVLLFLKDMKKKLLVVNKLIKVFYLFVW